MKRPAAWALAAALALPAGCGRRGPKIPAPDARFEEILQAPPGAGVALKDYRGQVVVLEFWATWCGPCLRLLPHMNKMVESFSDRPVRFLSVTDEDRAPVEAFMKAHPMKAWIALDPSGAAFRAFGVDSRPEVFVIDPYGRITLKIHPSFLYKSDIEDALKASPPPEGALASAKQEG